jgi:hypothetical protein
LSSSLADLRFGLTLPFFIPPAYLEGLSFTLQSSDVRSALLCGRYSGVVVVFPFRFFNQNPIASLLLFLFAFTALVLWRWFPRSRVAPSSADPRCPNIYDLSPLLILGGVYGLVCLASHLNIGRRHVLPTYPVLFALAGANVLWLTVKNLSSR